MGQYFWTKIFVFNQFYFLKVGHFPFTHVEFIDDGSIANEDVAESGSWGNRILELISIKMKQSTYFIISSCLTYFSFFISVNPTTWCNFSNKIKDSYNFSCLSVTIKNSEYTGNACYWNVNIKYLERKNDQLSLEVCRC